MKIYNELESLGFFEWLKEKGFGSGFTPMILDAQPFDSVERSGYNAIALRWFRKKYGLLSRITYKNEKYKFEYQYTSSANNLYTTEYKTYEEAELECLKKLIEIVKNEIQSRS